MSVRVGVRVGVSYDIDVKAWIREQVRVKVRAHGLPVWHRAMDSKSRCMFA